MLATYALVHEQCWHVLFGNANVQFREVQNSRRFLGQEVPPSLRSSLSPRVVQGSIGFVRNSFCRDGLAM